MRQLNEIEVAMMTYLDYVNRKIKEHPQYEPHPIVKAIALAIAGSEKQDDGRYSGVSGNEKEGLYVAVVEKRNGVCQILSLFDAKMGKQLGFDFAVRILKISMQLDKLDKDDVPMSDVVSILSDNCPSIKFKHLDPSEANEAIAYMRKLYKQGRIAGAISDKMRALIDQEINKDTEWENRSPEFRSLVGTIWGSKIEPKGPAMVLTNPSASLRKYQILDIVKMLILGSPSQERVQ